MNTGNAERLAAFISTDCRESNGGPYKMKMDLKSKKIIPVATYDKIAGMIIAEQK